MQIRHELRLVAEQRDQLVVHVERVARGEAEPLDGRHLGEPPQQLGERPCAAVGASPVIGIDVLPEQRDLARAVCRQPLDLGDDL